MVETMWLFEVFASRCMWLSRHWGENIAGGALGTSGFMTALGPLGGGAFLHVNGLVIALWGQFLFILLN